MRFVIHHPGKAGEVFMGLPAAQLLKNAYPGSEITWVVLDMFREALGDHPCIDRIEQIPTYSCDRQERVSSHMNRHRQFVFRGARAVEDQWGVHIDLYHGYIIDRSDKRDWRLNRRPFYLQMFANAAAFCPGTDPVRSWSPPDWHPTQRAIDDGVKFERQYGGGPVIIFSPVVADKTASIDNASTFSNEEIYSVLRASKLPLIVTGTQWDTLELPEWAVDGRASKLSLGGLFYLMKERASVVVTPNSGIGFAAHWLGAPTVMIDTRVKWKEQVREYKKRYRYLNDSARPEESRWPMFVKDNFPVEHLMPSPFHQIEWSPANFHKAVGDVLRVNMVN